MQGQPGSYQPEYTQLDYPRQGYQQQGYQQAGYQAEQTQLDQPQQGYLPQGFEHGAGFEQGAGGSQPPAPSSDSRMPWPPPAGHAPASLPPGGQSLYGAPVPPEEDMSDTDRMLRPQGLFRPQGQYGGPAQYGPPGQYGGSGQYGAPAQYGMPGPYGEPGQYGPPQWPGGQGPGGMPRTLPRGFSRVPRPPRAMLAVVAGVVVVVVAVTGVFLTMRGNAGAGVPDTTAGGGTPTATASSPSSTAEKQAATALAALLPQSGTDRGDVIDAVTAVQGCKTLPKDARIFSRAAMNRQTLLTKLSSLPGRSALPPALVSDLTGAWQASAQVDTDLAKWATDAIAHCRRGNPKDPNLVASYGPDGQASTGKAAFVKLWNPLARSFGLTTYTVDQL